WFNTYDHWLLKGFWLALVITTCVEFVFLTAIVRYGREEVAPHLTQQQWQAMCGVALIGGIALWSVVKANIDDPLYLTTFLLTITWCLPSTTALYLRRGIRRGISMRQVVSYWFMALGYILLTTIVFEFHEFWWIALCVLTQAWAT